MATTESEHEIAECLSVPLRPLHDIDDVVATSSADCNYENFEEFKDSADMAYFEQDFKGFLQDLLKKTESVLRAGDKCDIRNVFEEAGVATMKFNLFVWYFIENGKRPDSSNDEVQYGVLAASCYIAMCSLVGSRTYLFQAGLYNICLKVIRNCCHTVRIGEAAAAKKTGGPKKKKSAAKPNETAAGDGDEAETTEALIGPPRISVDSAERYLHSLTNQLFSFLRSDHFSIDAPTQMSTLEVIEDIGRLELDIKSSPRALRANSISEFRSLDRFADRYSAFLHILVESKYQTRKEMAFGRLVRPRLALLPYPDESNSTSKITTERKRAGEMAVCFILSRIARNPGAKELKLIEIILTMIYSQCPDYAEFRTNIAQFIHKILEALPYQYAYDFVQLMNTMFKGKTSGVKSLSNELANLLITGYDFTAPDPGPVPEVDKENEEAAEEEEPVEEEEEEEEPAPAPAPEEEAEGSDDDDDSDDEGNKSRRRKEKEKQEEARKRKKEKKKKEVKDIERMDALSVLYNIVYMACLDKAAAMRLHGSHSLAKILESPTHRVAFQQFCQTTNEKMDEKMGEVGANLEDELDDMNISGEAAANKKSSNKPTDMLLNDQNILEKWDRLKKMNQGAERVDKDIIYMIVRILAADDKAPVKKSSCALLKLYLSFCDEEVKFETVLSLLQKLCRDRMVSVRKMAAEAFTELMFTENIVFEKSMSSTWLHTLISMLNDTDNDVTEHARKLIMKVLTPLLDNPTDLTWTLLNSIESVTNQRNYLMTTLKDAVRERLVQKSVMESMKRHIRDDGAQKTTGAWMVFSQLCVQFEQNVDFAIEEFNRVDISKESDIVKYMMHVIENNIRKIDADVKEELVYHLKGTFQDYCLHSSHARSVYHCLGKLMDGIGDQAKYTREFQEFGEDLLVKSFDTIVQSFEMFKDKDEWKRNMESQERLLCCSLNVAVEVFSYSPQLIPRHERLAKTLSLIINSNDNHTLDASTVNPDMPSVHQTRPPTQMSDVPHSQKPAAGMSNHEGILFSEKVRATSVITLASMILAHDRLLKLMPMLVKQLQFNPSHQIRSNVVVAIGDICASYKTDRYAPMLAASLCDPSVLVRRHAINQIARLISLGIFRFNGEIMIRMMLASLDANEDVRNDAKLYISEVLQSEDPNFFANNFVQYMIALTQAKRLVGVGHDEDDRGQVDVAIGGGDPLARPSRIAVYTFMIESLNDRSRFDVKMSICTRVFMPIINGEYDFKEKSVQCLLDDALLIMGSSEMQIKMEVGKNPNENALEDPSPEAVEAATGLVQKVYLEHYMNTIVPSVLALREFLNQHRSPLQRKCLLAIRMICLEHDKDIDRILQDNRQLKDEMKFELNRVKHRSEEAHRILDEALARVAEFNRQQRRASNSSVPQAPEQPAEQPENEDVEMAPATPVRTENEDVPAVLAAPPVDESMKTPEKKRRSSLLEGSKTPGSSLRSRTEAMSTPQSARLLSPTTLKKIRRSVGALIQNEMCLNAPDLGDTHVVEEQLSVSRRANKTVEKEKTIVEEEPMDQDESTIKEVVEEAAEMPEEPEKPAEEEAEPVPGEQENNQEEQAAEEEDVSRRRSRRRKTPNYNEDESIDADGKVWKKPKIVTKSPEKEAANVSANVTIRRSRRGRPSEATGAGDEKKKTRKRKALSDDEDANEQEQQPTTSDNVENTPRAETTLVFDETKIGGRQCSTPIRGRSAESADVTFSLNLSAITEREDLKNRKSHAHLLKEIFEENEDEEESN